MLRKKLPTIVMHLLGWVIFLSLPLLFMSGSYGGDATLQIIRSPYYWLFFACCAGIFYFHNKVLFPRLLQEKKYILYGLTLLMLLAGVFLLKPFDHLFSVRNDFQEEQNRMVKINFSQVTYIESLEDYIRIHFTEEKPVMTLMPLKKILEKLPENQFSRVHRSYVVAQDKITAIRNRKITLSTGVEIPISASHADFTRKFKQ